MQVRGDDSKLSEEGANRREATHDAGAAAFKLKLHAMMDDRGERDERALVD